MNDGLLFGERGHIGWAGNSGFQAFNLALQFGAKRIALCGFDCSAVRGFHFHGRHPPGLNNPTAAALEKWRIKMDAQANILRDRGVEVFIATPDSALQNYARRPLMELLDELEPQQLRAAEQREPAAAAGAV